MVRSLSTHRVDVVIERPYEVVIVEVKGYRREDAKAKKDTMEVFWIPGVNHLGSYGRWTSVELTDAFAMEESFELMMRDAMGESSGRDAPSTSSPNKDPTE